MARSRLFSLFLASTLAWVGSAGAANMPEGDYTDKHARTTEGSAPAQAERSRQGARSSDSDKSFGVVRSAGRDVPLHSADQGLLPTGGCWTLLIQRGLEDTPVSWGRGAAWPTIVRRMASRAGLEAAFNYQDCIVAIASSRRIATHMATTGGNVWHVREGETIKAILERWAERAGWHLSWEPDFTYEVEYPGTLVGQFYGSDGANGVFERVLRTYDDAAEPLVAQWVVENRVVRVMQKTAKVEQ